MLAYVLTALGLLGVLVPTVHATTYTVIQGGGGDATTINGGIALMGRGDTLLVHSGEYDECLSQGGLGGQSTPIPYGFSWEAPTTIKAAPGHTVWLKPSQLCANDGATIELYQDADAYYVFDGINIDNGDIVYYCTSTYLVRHVKFMNMEVKNSAKEGGGCHTGGGGPSGDYGGPPANGNGDVWYINQHVHHCGLGTGGPGTHCYYLLGGPFYIEGGEIHDANTFAIQTTSEGRKGSGSIRGVNIHGNRRALVTASGVTIHSNIMHNNTEHVAWVGGGTEIHNNTLYNCGDGYYCLLTQGASGVTWRNNIFLGTGIPTDIAALGGSLIASNNLCASTGGAGNVGCTLTGTPNATFAGPSPFTMPDDFRLAAGSPALNAGMNLSSQFTTDYTGASRVTPWDLGAYDAAAAPTGEAVALQWALQPPTGSPGAVLAPAPAVRAIDGGGNLVTSFTANITVGLGANPGGSTLSGTLTRPASGGSASFTDLRLSQPGTGYTLVATTSGLPAATSMSFTITPPVATSLAFGPQHPTDTPAGSPMTPPLQVRIMDQNFALIPTATHPVTLALEQNPTGATFTPQVVNAVNGIASFPNIVITTVGTGYTFRATSPGLAFDLSDFFAVTAAPPPTSVAIKVDQFGYRPDMTKIAVLSDPQTGYNAAESYTPGATLAVRRTSDNVVVFSAAPSAWNAGATHTQSGDKVWWFDFTSVTTPGTYHIYDAANSLQSDAFVIGDTAYSQLLRATTRMFFYQRSGFAKATPFADARWTDGAAFLASNQDPGARLVTDQGNATTARDLRGGWFDAGDYNKYTTWASHALQDLLLTYEQFPTLFPDSWGLPESGNGLSDLLDEVKWELDWLLRMQQANGSVLSKVSSLLTECSSPPSADTRARFYGAASTASTASAAAAYALGAKVFTAAGQTTYGTTLQTAAQNAWTWAQANPSVVFDNAGFATANPEPNAYGRSMEVLRAAIFLYALTGTATYRTYIDANYTAAQPIQWDYWYGFEQVIQAALLYYTTTPGATAASVTDIRNSKITSIGGSEFTAAYTGATDAYRAYLKDADYTFGSNRPKSYLGSIYLDMLQYNLDSANHATYRSAGAGYLHYLHGVNPQGLVYLTNMASLGAGRSSTEQYHCWFHDGTIYDNATSSPNGPALGFLVGGPNAAYTGNQTPPLGQPQQKSFRDWNGVGAEKSWEITEPAIYYQAAYLRLLAQFTAHTVVPAPTDLSVTTFSTGHFLQGK